LKFFQDGPQQFVGFLNGSETERIVLLVSRIRFRTKIRLERPVAFSIIVCDKDWASRKGGHDDDDKDSFFKRVVAGWWLDAQIILWNNF
jgi:hypothetical protein